MDDPFGRVPYFALPMMFMIIVVIGVAIYTQEKEKKATATPTPTAIIRTIPENCVTLDTADSYIILKCEQNRYR